MKPRLFLLGGAFLGLLALLLVLSGADSSRAGTFSPVLKVTIADPEPEANSDFTTDFNIPEGDVNFAPLVSFIPKYWGITAGDKVPIGAVSGELSAQATLGLINGACNTILPVPFTMLNASIDTEDTVPYLDTDENGTGEIAEDKDKNGLKDAIDKYPDFINRVLKDESDKPLQPLRRAAGITVVAASVNVILQFLIFEPGTLIDASLPSDVELGYPTLTLLQNAGDPGAIPVPNPITDFCTPLISTNTAFGVSQDNPDTKNVDESGEVLLANPKDGKYTFTNYALGQRDADDDGHENALDPCPFHADPNWDPRASDLDDDPDSDGIPNSCDPTPDEDTNFRDHDLDGYFNRGENCPLVPNGTAPGQSNQNDSDLDAIGDECDSSPNSPDGHVHVTCVVNPVDIGSGGSPAPADPHSLEPCAVDTDGDGILDANDACPNQPEDFDSFQDSDGCPEPCPGGDVNGDGRVDLRDVVLVGRALGSRPGDRRWNPAADLNHNGRVDLGDLSIVVRSSLDPTCRPTT